MSYQARKDVAEELGTMGRFTEPVRQLLTLGVPAFAVTHRDTYWGASAGFGGMTAHLAPELQATGRDVVFLVFAPGKIKLGPMVVVGRNVGIGIRWHKRCRFWLNQTGTSAAIVDLSTYDAGYFVYNGSRLEHRSGRPEDDTSDGVERAIAWLCSAAFPGKHRAA